MKTLITVTAAIFLGLSGGAMAAEENCGIYCSNSTGPNPFMPEFSTPVSHGDAHTYGYSAFGQYHPARHHIVHRHVEK